MTSVDLVVKGSKVWTHGGLVEGGLAVRDGKIVAIANDYSLPTADRTIDTHGNLVIPGFVDEHVHLGDPWEAPDRAIAVMREDFAHGTMAAAAGGVTTLLEMPDTVPLVTNIEAAKAKLEVCKGKAYVDFGLHGGFIPGTEYEREIQNLYQLGLTGMKTFTCSAMPEWPPCYDGDLYDALKIVQDVGAVALLHSENEFLISKNEKRLRSEARTDIKAYLESRTPITEIESAHRMVFFLKQTHAKGLIVHTSVPEAVLEVKAAKDEGYAVCVETCPHYLFLTEEDIVSHRPFSKTAPPARDKDRVAKMWQLLNLGYIDTLASDHSPCTMEERMTALRNIWDGRNGASNIEASLPLMMNAINTGRTTLNRVIQVACENPAKLFGLYPRKGTLQVSSDADFVVVDMNATHELSNEMTKSKCGWTLYDGFATQGAPRMVFLRGNMIMQDGEILGRQGYGQFVTRDGIT